MELRQLRYFVAVAEELHFTRAAERLGITQPPLSQQIQKLEAELGVSLFSRNNRGVTLTEAGRVLLDGARRTLVESDRALHQVERVARGEVGSLMIGTVSSAWHGLLPRVLRAYRTHYPDVEILATSMSTTEQVERLLTGSLDAGFLRAPINQPALETEVMIPDSLMVAIPASHPLADYEQIELRELVDEPLVIFPRRYGPGGYDLIVQMCIEAGFRPQVVQETVEINAVIGLVNAGMGVSIVPSSIRQLRIEDIRYIPLAGEHPVWNLALTWRRENDTPVVNVFLDVARKIAAKMRAEGVHLP
ncbi:LysR family transcriptional regulator [soil metagenome]